MKEIYLMRNFFITLVLFLFCTPFSVSAEIMVIQVNPNSLPYELSPSNYNNAPLNYDNSFLNYDNSVTNYDNSPSNYDNSPSNYENSFGINRLYNQERVIVGYAVYSSIGTLNIFSVSGRRLGYVPATNNTQSIFASETSIWCGTLGILNGSTVIALSQSCYYKLLSNQ